MWPRSLHARLINSLIKADAAVIAFDLVFDTPSKDAEQDALFAAAIERAQNVVLVERLNFDEVGLLEAVDDEPHAKIIREWEVPLCPIIGKRDMRIFGNQKYSRFMGFFSLPHRLCTSDLVSLPHLPLGLLTTGISFLSHYGFTQFG